MGAPPQSLVATFACFPPTQDNVSCPYKELHRRTQLRCSHASSPPSTTLRGPIGSSTEGLSGGVRMRFPYP
eukprot:4922347-Pyramimonas_sp.AAC.1